MKLKFPTFSQIVHTPFKKWKLDNVTSPVKFIGKKIKARLEMDAPDEEITIEHVCGSLAHVKHYEINGTHWVSILSFHMQLEEGREPTKEEEEEFNLATEIKDIKEIRG